LTFVGILVIIQNMTNAIKVKYNLYEDDDIVLFSKQCNKGFLYQDDRFLNFIETNKTVYALQLEKNKFYIGCSLEKNIDNRINDHFTGVGSKWTQKYKPLSIIEKYQNTSELFELILTLKYIDLYGSKNVRGSGFVKVAKDIIVSKELKKNIKTIKSFNQKEQLKAALDDK
jgi:predicted GIY-YIG superfamily endonuclease